MDRRLAAILACMSCSSSQPRATQAYDEAPSRPLQQSAPILRAFLHPLYLNGGTMYDPSFGPESLVSDAIRRVVPSPKHVRRDSVYSNHEAFYPFMDQCRSWTSAYELCDPDRMKFPTADSLRPLVAAPPNTYAYWTLHLVHDRDHLMYEYQHFSDDLRPGMDTVVEARFSWTPRPGMGRSCRVFVNPSTGQVLPDPSNRRCTGSISGRPIGLAYRRSAPELTGRAARWASIAADEDEATEAFRVHVAELRTLGAPPSFRRRAREAMRDERAHRDIALQMASRFADRTVQLGARCEHASPRRNRMSIIESVARDGAVNETLSYALLVEEAKHCSNADERRSIESIAREEASHAALAWDTLAWVWPSLNISERTHLLHLLTQRPNPSSILGYIDEPGRVQDEVWASVMAPLIHQLADAA